MTDKDIAPIESIYDIFETPELDNDSFDNGKWFQINASSSIKIRHAASPNAIAVRKEVEEPYALRIEAGVELTDKEHQEIALSIISRSLIADWKGPIFVDDKGKAMKCTPKNAYSLLVHPKMEKFLLFVMNLSKNEENYLAKLDDSSEKN